MAKARSPNYPGISLGEAIEAIKAVYKADHRNPMDAATVAKHLGHNSLNGRALVKVSALRKYGLLEPEGNHLRVSEDAVTIIADSVDSPERRAVISKLAFEPSPFAEIRERYDRKPSHENLKSYLMKHGFTEDAALKAAGKYLENFELVTEEGNGYGSIQGDENPKEAMPPEPHKPQPPTPPQPGQQAWAWSWTLSVPRNVNAELRMSGPVSETDFDLLKKQIDTLEAAFKGNSEPQAKQVDPAQDD